jgi:ABC-type sugar transport system ATPase subunit
VASLSVHDLRKQFGPLVVVDNVSVDIADGEFVVLVGPSGCGKSTTLRMIAGLEACDGGTILIGERVVNDAHPADRDVAMVFQNYALYPHMSVFDNLAYGLKRRGIARETIGQRVRAVASMLRLGELLHRRPAQLSGGQRQRVALGRAIVREPAVFLMDEPLSNLDAKLRVEMRAELQRLHAELRATIVYVTHDQVEAMTMGNRIVVMNHGRIEQTGPPLEVYNRPASLFVAQFVGLPEINLIPGRIKVESGSVRFLGNDVNLRFPAAGNPSTADDLILGLRPQSLFGSRSSASENDLLGSATVVAVEHHGPESFASCTVGSTRLTIRVAPNEGLLVGSKITVAVDITGAHIFSRTTGQRLDRIAPPPR